MTVWGPPTICGLALSEPLTWVRMSDRTIWTFDGDTIVESFDGRGASIESSDRRFKAEPKHMWDIVLYGEGPAADVVRASVRRLTAST